MVSKQEFVDLESLKDTDLCRMNEYRDAFKWDPANEKEKEHLITEYSRKLIFPTNEFGAGFHFTFAHVVKDLAMNSRLTESEKFVILLTVATMVNDTIVARSMAANMLGIK